MADALQCGLAFLGIKSAPAFVRAPAGNGCAERLTRTLKENLLWVRRFASLEEVQAALAAFHEIYNTTWFIERFRPPAAVRESQAAATSLAA